jgi:hypothetical protein
MLTWFYLIPVNTKLFLKGSEPDLCHWRDTCGFDANEWLWRTRLLHIALSGGSRSYNCAGAAVPGCIVARVLLHPGAAQLQGAELSQRKKPSLGVT